MMLKIKIALAVFAIIFLATVLSFCNIKKPQMPAVFWNLHHDKLKTAPLVNKFHSSGFFELKNAIIESLKFGESEKKENYSVQIGITSHHLPTAISFISDFYKQLFNSSGSRETFIILGPDHFEKCQNFVATSKMPYLTPFGELAVDEELSDKLLQAGAFIDDKCFETEHSVAVQTIFIKYLFPEAKIVPLLFSVSTESNLINKISEVLYHYKGKITVITSVDFSHYQNLANAKKIDIESENMIRNLDAFLFDVKHVDSPPAVKLAVLLAQKLDSITPKILKTANSFDFTNNPDNTTGYINAVFINSKSSKNLAKILFVGDLMFDRNIRSAAQKNGNNFIFEKLSDLLASNDLVVANLEGLITNEKSVSVGTLPNSGANFIFTFDPSLAKTLFEENIKLVNLGNNHILNFGQAGLNSTRKYLDEASVEYFGDPGGKKSLIKEIKGAKIGFVNYNQFVGGLAENQNETVEEIKKIKAQSDIVILYAHWGVEYVYAPAAIIKDLAYRFIDAGADLVVGTHPHVIELVEDYKGKKIYYSIGNFIFDQYFNEDVRLGMGVIVTLDSSSKQLEFIEKKLYLEKNGQTILSE